LKLPEEIRETKQPEGLVAVEEVFRHRPDIWFYKKEETHTRNEPIRILKCK
jgi:hypothetical protein